MRRVIFILAVLPLLHGCTLFSRTEIVHPNAVERPVLFESQDAEDVFREAVRKTPRETEGWRIGGDWGSVYEESKQLSEAARFNQAVLGCDTNRDGVIVTVEAVRFAELRR